MKSEDGINRKLFLLNEVYEVFSVEKIKQTIIDFEKTLEEMESIIDTLSRVEAMLAIAGEDTAETADYIRVMCIQKIYLAENLQTFKDALSLHENTPVNKIYFPNSDSWGEISNN